MGTRCSLTGTSSSFSFESASDAAAKLSGDEVGDVYSRYTNPTVRDCEQRLVELRERECAAATASGMSAILMRVTRLRKGDHVLHSRDVSVPQ